MSTLLRRSPAAWRKWRLLVSPDERRLATTRTMSRTWWLDDAHDRARVGQRRRVTVLASAACRENSVTSAPATVSPSGASQRPTEAAASTRAPLG